MNPTRSEVVEAEDGLTGADRLDWQLSELIEAVWACERAWALEAHIDAAIRYGRLVS